LHLAGLELIETGPANSPLAINDVSSFLVVKLHLGSLFRGRANRTRLTSKQSCSPLGFYEGLPVYTIRHNFPLLMINQEVVMLNLTISHVLNGWIL
jgi:hypothetical protein